MKSTTFSLASLSFGLLALAGVSLFRGDFDLMEIELHSIGKLKIENYSRQSKSDK